MLTKAERENLINQIKDNTLTELKNLKNIDDNEIEYLADALACNTSIVTLELNNCISNSGVSYLAKALKKNITLKSLLLDNNKIGDEGAYCLAEMLKENQYLIALDLHSNKIGKEGIKHLSCALMQHSSFPSALRDKLGN